MPITHHDAGTLVVCSALGIDTAAYSMPYVALGLAATSIASGAPPSEW